MRAAKLNARRSVRAPARSAADYLPSRLTIKSLEKAAEHCQGCELYKRATQTVFGEGPADARLMLVGETPGDEEDLQGHPFVGPAGRLLDEALKEVGVVRSEVYVTNAVKHFKWEPRGKRRLHSKPSSREMAACRPWLDAELEVLHPKTIVCLGATAAQTLLGRAFRVTKQRGQLLESQYADWVLATYHPSAVLRAPDSAARRRIHQELVHDLKVAVKSLKA